jgi:hypothetical protein
MTEALGAYRQLETRLRNVRSDNNGQESPEEDEILDSMDVLWYDLTPEEREMLQNEGPSCW